MPDSNYLTLEQRYNAAAEDTNAGRARVQATSATTAGVNFTDAGPRPAGADEFQDEFSRNPAGTKTFVQGTATDVSQGEKAGLSRWYGRALNFAFTAPQAPSIKDSLWDLYKGLRVGTLDAWTDNPSNFHRYTRNTQFPSTLSGYAKIRAQPRSLPE